MLVKLGFLKNTVKKSYWHLKGKYSKKYGPFKEIDNTWRTRRNDKLNHIIGNRNIVNC
jgi:hypothetical protein